MTIKTTLSPIPTIGNPQKKEVCAFAQQMNSSYAVDLKIDNIYGINKHKYIVFKGWAVDEARFRTLTLQAIQEEIELIEKSISQNSEEASLLTFTGIDEYFKIQVDNNLVDKTEIYLLTIIMQNFEGKDYMLMSKQGELIPALKLCKE